MCQIAFRSYCLAPNGIEPVDATEDRAVGDACGDRPFIHRPLGSYRHRDGPNMFPFSDQISNHPVLLPKLKITTLQSDELGSTEPTPDQQRDDGPIALAAGGLDGERLNEPSSLLDCQPVSTLVPNRLAPLTRRMPAASSGLRIPVSAAS